MKNQTIITGNLGLDPEVIRRANEGGAVAKLSLAHSEYRYNEQTDSYQQAHTSWFTIKVFGGLAERAIEALKKGDLVTVYGSLRSSSYEDKGQKRTSTEVIAGDILKVEVLPKSSREAMKDLGVTVGKSISVPKSNEAASSENVQ